MALNNVTLMGRITAAPELKTTNKGTSVTSFTIAVDRAFSDDTDFINIVAWRQTAEFITKYFSKGNLIAIQGSIQTRNYEDKSGAKRTAVEVIADRVSFCGEKNNADMKEVIPDVSEDDLPF